MTNVLSWLPCMKILDHVLLLAHIMYYYSQESYGDFRYNLATQYIRNLIVCISPSHFGLIRHSKVFHVSQILIQMLCSYMHQTTLLYF